PAMAGVRTFRDVAVVFDFAAGESTEWWVVFGNQRYGATVAAGVTGVSVAQQFPFVDSGQLIGLLGGGVGGGEYENLIDAPEHGTRRAWTLSFVNVLILLLIVIGNIVYLRQRRMEARQ
ncbi:MAG: hypothetical protein O3A46_11165, partial [Candidatus Poribacteria bacterium]|nr:hypothetical protein [Candidatus Poribacteria bacterium]